MDLEGDPEPRPFKPLNEFDFPQRTLQVERGRGQLVDVRSHLDTSTRLGQRNPPYVIVQRERRVVHPPRTAQTKDRACEPLLEPWQTEQPLSHGVPELVVLRRVAAEQQHPGKLHAVLGVLHLEERVVQRTEPVSHPEHLRGPERACRSRPARHTA
jgi:hypothetical protein